MPRRRLTRAALGVVALVAVAVVVGNCYVTRSASPWTYTSGEQGEVAGVPRRTWAIVPGAMVRPDGTASDALADRLNGALDLYQEGRVSRIFVSGDGNSDEDGVMARWLEAAGVPASAIVRDGAGYRTRTTMSDAYAVGIRDAVVCTQAFHLARSIVWARHEGIDAVGVEVADRRWVNMQLKARVREVFSRTVATVELWVD